MNTMRDFLYGFRVIPQALTDWFPGNTTNEVLYVKSARVKKWKFSNRFLPI